MDCILVCVIVLCRCFTKPSQLFLDPPYNCLQQRISLINKTSNPQEGVYPDKMKVSSVKSCKFAKYGDWYLNPEACQYWAAQHLGEFAFLFDRRVLKHIISLKNCRKKLYSNNWTTWQ